LEELRAWRRHRDARAGPTVVTQPHTAGAGEVEPVSVLQGTVDVADNEVGEQQVGIDQGPVEGRAEHDERGSFSTRAEAEQEARRIQQRWQELFEEKEAAIGRLTAERDALLLQTSALSDELSSQVPVRPRPDIMDSDKAIRVATRFSSSPPAECLGTWSNSLSDTLLRTGQERETAVVLLQRERELTKTLQEQVVKVQEEAFDAKEELQRLRADQAANDALRRDNRNLEELLQSERETKKRVELELRNATMRLMAMQPPLPPTPDAHAVVDQLGQLRTDIAHLRATQSRMAQSFPKGAESPERVEA